MKNMVKKLTFFICLSLLAGVYIFRPHNVDAQLLKIGFVTDWEYHERDYATKLSTKAPEFLNDAVEGINNKSPHLTIGGGDYVESTKLSSSKTKKMLKSINKTFRKIKTGKRYYLTGNHDLRSLRKSEYMKALGINYLHKVVDIRGFRIILLDTNFKEGGSHRSDESYVEGYVSDAELKWLENNIAQSNSPVIIFSHHSPGRPNGRRDIKNSPAVRSVIENSGKVVAVISGHNPDQWTKTYSSVRYYVVNNLVNPKAKRTYAFIKATRTGDTVDFSLKQYGQKKKSYHFVDEYDL